MNGPMPALGSLIAKEFFCILIFLSLGVRTAFLWSPICFPSWSIPLTVKAIPSLTEGSCPVLGWGIFLHDFSKTSCILSENRV